MQPKSAVQVTRCASLDTNPCSAVLIPTTRTAARPSLCHACLRRRAKTLAWQSLSQTNEANSYNPRSLSVVAPVLEYGVGLGFLPPLPCRECTIFLRISILDGVSMRAGERGLANLDR